MGRKKKKKRTKRGKYLTPYDEYVYSPEPITLKELAKKWKGHKGASLGQLGRLSTEYNWPGDRKRVWKEIRNKMERMTTEKIAVEMRDSVVETNRRHRQHGKAMQGIGVKTLAKFRDKVEDMKVGEGLRIALKALKDGVDVERKALGLADQVIKVQFAKDMGREFVEIVTKYVNDPDVLENINRDIGAVIERESSELDEMVESAGLSEDTTIH